MSTIYIDIILAMESLINVTEFLITLILFAVIIILVLLILYITLERKFEIGILLALGQRRWGIISNFICELLLISFIGMTFAFIIGNRFNGVISNTFVKQEMTRIIDDPNRIVNEVDLHKYGFRVDLTHEEMIELFDTSIGVEIAFRFYLYVSILIIIASIIPLVVIFRANPKTILLKTN